jgi:phosphoglycolate phosphatase
LKPVRLVVFDLDGTLVDSSADLAGAVKEALEKVAPEAPLLSLSEVRALVGNGARVLITRSLGRAGIDRNVDDVVPVFLDCYRRRLLDQTRLYPGVSEALDALAAPALAVLTNKPGDMSREILEGLGVARRFDRICGAGDVPGRKPDPGGLLQLMRDAFVSPDETLMVGDSAIDVQTGHAAGTGTVGVTYGFDPQSLLADPPDFSIDDLRKLEDLLVAPRPTVLT